MKLQPLFEIKLSASASRCKSSPALYPDVKPWVRKAIAEEDEKPNTQLWRKEPSADYQRDERLRRIRFLRKHEQSILHIKAVAERLELCGQNSRCCSGACPECGRLLQRWFVRNSKALIRDVINQSDQRLVAITIIPADPIIKPGQLCGFSIVNFQRRLKSALDKAKLGIAIGGIDFSFNEDKKGKYRPFWSPHIYLITSTANKKKVHKALTKIYKPSKKRVPKPIYISPFENTAERRSYAVKMTFERRIGFDAEKTKSDGTIRKCRNTSHDRLRAKERLELFIYLDQCGLANRFIFRGAKPIIKKGRVRMRKI